MVVVVPAFAQRQYANDGVIAAVVAAFVWLLAPNVTHAVDAPRHMVFETDTDDAAPEQTRQCAHPRACDDTVLYSGGSFGSQYPGAQATVDQWAQQNGCQSMGTQVVNTIDFDGYVGGAETDVYRSSGCDSPGSVELWKCNGSGHGFNVTASGKDAVFSYMLEHSKSIVAACPADISGDQVVDVRDLLLLLQEWGSGAGTPSDIDASGMVDVDDLSILLAAWGECPSL